MPGGQPRSFWAPWQAKRSPTMMRNSANTCAEKRPITASIHDLRPDGIHIADQSAMRKTFAIVTLLLLCLACNRHPAESTQGSTDTIQSTPSSTSGTTATETGGGPPVQTESSPIGNASGSGSTGTTGTIPAGTSTVTSTGTTATHT